MKLVTYKISDFKEPEAASAYTLKLGQVFPSLDKSIHHPLAPIGRLGFLIGENVIDVAAASMKYVIRSDEQSLLLPTLPADIITFLVFGEKAMTLANNVHDRCLKRTLEELNIGFTIAWPVSEVKLYAPVPRPTSMRDGY